MEAAVSSPWDALAHQCRGRALSAAESAFAEALEAIFTDGVTDFDEIARQLTARGIEAPISHERQWTRALIEQELSSINRSLDQSYARGQLSA